MPSVKSVKLVTKREERFRHLRRDVEVIVDDGHLTKLERKGDGVQSLVALALMRHASDQSTSQLSTVVAIEEPESHLHPRAIHELKQVIESLSDSNQIVLTSHSPLFVNPSNLSNTIIVQGSKAACANHVSQIREALGVRFSDNLQNARLILLVEGADDVIALLGIIPTLSEALDAGLKSGAVALDSLAEQVLCVRRRRSTNPVLAWFNASSMTTPQEGQRWIAPCETKCSRLQMLICAKSPT